MKKKALALFLVSGILGVGFLGSKWAISGEDKSYRIFEANGWFGNGNKESFKISFDEKNKFEGKKSILIEAKKELSNDFATIIQSINPEKYLNKRVRFSGYIKTENAGGGCLWMRIDDKNAKVLQFDNMYNRFPKGNTDWKKYEVVLDIPQDSKAIVFGAFLQDKGKAWFDNFNFEVVDKTVKSTNMKDSETSKKADEKRKEPENLNFEK